MHVIERTLSDGSEAWDVVTDDCEPVWGAPSRYAAYAFVEIATAIMDCGSDHEIREIHKAIERTIA